MFLYILYYSIIVQHWPAIEFGTAFTVISAHFESSQSLYFCFRPPEHVDRENGYLPHLNRTRPSTRHDR